MALLEFPQTERRDALIDKLYSQIDESKNVSTYATIDHVNNYLQGYEA